METLCYVYTRALSTHFQLIHDVILIYQYYGGRHIFFTLLRSFIRIFLRLLYKLLLCRCLVLSFFMVLFIVIGAIFVISVSFQGCHYDCQLTQVGLHYGYGYAYVAVFRCICTAD